MSRDIALDSVLHTHPQRKRGNIVASSSLALRVYVTNRHRTLRSALAWILALAIGSLAVGSATAEEKAAATSTAAANPRALLENEDETNFFFFHDIPAGRAGEVIDRYVDVLADAGVTTILWNTNARRTNYRSDVWPAYWDGYDPAGPDDQPFLAPVPLEQRAQWRKLTGNMLEVHRQGIDFPARVIERSRQRGMSPWITLRMNDVHENANLAHPIHSPLSRRPELFRQGATGYFARALDYARPEVRDHYRALVVETLSRYDINGLELDFMREPYLFSQGKEAEGGVLLTAWLRDVRKLVDEAAKRRGHAVKMGVRVPSHPETALGLGFDAPTWSSERLVDTVVVTPRWASLEFDMPLGKWRELLGDRVTLAGGLEVSIRSYPGGPGRAVTAEEATGAAVAALSSGADVVYLFNYFQDASPGWPIPEYQRVLGAMGSLETLLKLPRRHAVTYREVVAPGENYHAPLPASGTDLAFELPLGPTPPAGWRAEATIELGTESAKVPPPALSVNGLAGTLASDEPLPGGNRLLKYSIPLEALPGRNQDKIQLKAGEKITVVRVAIDLGGG